MCFFYRPRVSVMCLLAPAPTTPSEMGDDADQSMFPRVKHHISCPIRSGSEDQDFVDSFGRWARRPIRTLCNRT